MGSRSTLPVVGEPLNIPTSIAAKTSYKGRPPTSFQSQPWNQTDRHADNKPVSRNTEATQTWCIAAVRKTPVCGTGAASEWLLIGFEQKPQKAKNTSENKSPDIHRTPATLSRGQPQMQGHLRVSNSIHMAFEALFQVSLPCKSHLLRHGWSWGLR